MKILSYRWLAKATVYCMYEMNTNILWKQQHASLFIIYLFYDFKAINKCYKVEKITKNNHVLAEILTVINITIHQNLALSKTRMR